MTGKEHLAAALDGISQGGWDIWTLAVAFVVAGGIYWGIDAFFALFP